MTKSDLARMILRRLLLEEPSRCREGERPASTQREIQRLQRREAEFLRAVTSPRYAKPRLVHPAPPAPAA